MATSFRVVSVIAVLSSLFLLASCQTCSNYTFSNNKVFSSCSDLPCLDAHIHWNYNSSTRRAEIAYRATQEPTGWIAWGINPTESGMPGSQVLVAFLHSNGNLIAYPTAITSYDPPMEPSSLSFPVSNISAEYAKNEMIIFAVVGPLGNSSTVNQIWQTGTSVSNDIPQMHELAGPHLQSLGTLDFLSG
ncbi:Cytochrome b561 and domon domain-containing protein [Thalictrum thalictroides]|uniref:Cytochrome b561 and domon domain-containing protein n=1 Tax=Thalictrum thalictroides TaxID=46969 RepID=A0A7J6WZ42_THATH|nr:Cytochrome b561 and domon domain-containing protein [Thalictrum thalictroides]